MKNFKVLTTTTVALGMLVLLSACVQPVSSDLTGTPEVYVPPVRPTFAEVQQNQPLAGPGEKTKYIQKADLNGQTSVPMDILFVVDTSDSMCADQASLAKNINRFVEKFTQNNKIDFHIGVTATWDSRLFRGNRKWKNGELRKVFGQSDSVRFVTNETPNLQQTLERTLNIGLEPHDSTKPETSGPEREELFSPIIAALSDEMASGVNAGFRRRDAHLAVVIVTDTEDDTPDFLDPSKNMKASFIASELQAKVRGAATVTVLAALARYDQMVQFNAGQEPGLSSFNRVFPNGSLRACSEYSVDPALVPALKGPKEIASLVTQMKGIAFDLRTNDFGGKMSGLGQVLLKKAINYKIVLDRAPDVSEPMVVKINGQTLQRNDLTGWTYLPDTNTVILNESLELGQLDKFEVEISYTIL